MNITSCCFELDLRFLLIETFASHGQIPCVPGTEGKNWKLLKRVDAFSDCGDVTAAQICDKHLRQCVVETQPSVTLL